MKILNYIIAALIMLVANVPCLAYDDQYTHRQLTEKAVDHSRLDAYLVNNLNLEKGVSSSLPSGSSETLKYLLMEGSKLEDSPNCRAASHFLNPLKPWDEAGVSDTNETLFGFEVNTACFVTAPFSSRFSIHKYSDVTWATGFTSPPSPTSQPGETGNDMDWNAARKYYRLALTEPAKNMREEYFAITFQTLGHVMHLLQDMAVPAHVRNDFTAHLAFQGAGLSLPNKWYGNTYEWYVKDKKNQGVVASAMASSSAVPHPNLLTTLWDANTYDGSNPSNGYDHGLAEYTSANFFSESTFFAGSKDQEDIHYFPRPAKSDTNASEVEIQAAAKEVTAEDGIKDRVIYVTKNNGGYRVAAYSFLRKWVEHKIVNDGGTPQEISGYVSGWEYILDDEVYKDYTKELLPRAVGYSAALLDYFFRGTIDMVADTGTSGRYVIKNESGEDMSGTFRLYYDNDQGIRSKVSGAEWPLDVTANGESSPVAFTAPTDAKEPGKYMLVFQGGHGAEAGAVVGREVDLEIGEKYGLGGLIADGGSLNGYLVRLRFKTSQTERIYSKFFEEPRFIRLPDGTYYTELLSAGRSNRFNPKQTALAFLTTSPGVYESKIRVFDLVNGEIVKLYEEKEILQDPEPEAPEAPSSPAFCGEVPGDWGTFEGWAKGYQIKDVFWRGELDPIIYYTVSYIGGYTYWSGYGSSCEGIQYSIVKHFIDGALVKTDSVVTRSSREEDTDWNGVIVPAQREQTGTLSTFLSITNVGNLMLETKNVEDSYKLHSYYRIYPANNKYSYLKLGDYHYSRYGYETDCNEGTSFSDLLENGESSGSSFILSGEDGDVIKIVFTKQAFYYYSYFNLIFSMGVNNGPLTNLTLPFPNNGYSFLDLNPISIGYLKREKLID